MLIVMKADATDAQVAHVCEVVSELGFKPHTMPGATCTAIGVTGNQGAVDPTRFENLPGGAGAIRVSSPPELITLLVRPAQTIARVGYAGRMAFGRGIHNVGGQLSGRALRARRAHVRAAHAQHARPRVDSRRPPHLASARRGGSIAWHGEELHGYPAGLRRRRRRRRR